MSTDPTIQELRALVGLITRSLDTIESTANARGEKFPSLHEPFTRESEAIRNLPDVAAACDVLVSAAGQLIATVRSPGMGVVMTTLQVCHEHTVTLRRLSNSFGSMRSLRRLGWPYSFMFLKL